MVPEGDTDRVKEKGVQRGNAIRAALALHLYIDENMCGI